MAEVKQITTWNGLRVEIGTDPATGNTTWRDPTSGTVWATSAGSNNPAKNWDASANLTAFTNAYNSRPGATNQLTEDEFLRQFAFGNTPGATDIGLGNSGTALGNQARSDIINNNDNYDGIGDPDLYRQILFNSGIPGVTNPTTGQVINSSGIAVIDPNIGGFFQTLENGSPFDLNQNFFDQSGDIGSPFTVPDSTFSGDGSEFDLNQNFFDQGGGGGSSARSRSSGGGLKYPLNDPVGLDYIKIDILEYVPSLNVNPGTGALGGSFQNANQRYRVENTKGTIYLPMQPALSETTSIDWGEDRLNSFMAASANALMGGMKALGTFQSGEDFNSKIAQVLRSLGADANEILKDQNLEKFVKAYFAGTIVGSNIVGRSSGMVVNPNLELLFNGPRLRQFIFNFKLTPREPAEAQVIRDIILTLKRASAPKREGGQLFLKFPDIFKLEYVYQGSGQHPFMHKFKPCALTNLSVDYTPDGSYMTYKDVPSMTAYNLSLSFGEIDPIYEEDQTSGMGY
jgi:hypothetical protein